MYYYKGKPHNTEMFFKAGAWSQLRCHALCRVLWKLTLKNHASYV